MYVGLKIFLQHITFQAISLNAKQIFLKAGRHWQYSEIFSVDTKCFISVL